MVSKPKKPKPAPNGAQTPLMTAKEGGATVRFYRIGHGDCFLIAFDRGVERPFFVMIDCGRKNGSDGREYWEEPRSPKAIADHIMAATGGKIDVVILTHEHDDHLNGINEKNFPGIDIGELWLAWTESETDELAIELDLQKKKDLQTLKLAHGLRLKAAPESPEGKAARFIDDLFAMEAGMPVEDYGAGGTGAAGKAKGPGVNQTALHYFRESAQQIRYLYPHQKPIPLGGRADQKAFVLGPPHDKKALKKENPNAANGFPDGKDHALAFSFAGAVMRDELGGKGQINSPFAREYSVPLNDALTGSFARGHYLRRYGGYVAPGQARPAAEASPHLDWRRIDGEWLDTAGSLALQLNTGTNNTSLVIAFELSPGGKVLLFAADAQAGNWLSWNDAAFPSGGKDDKPIWPKELLKRTVLYKTGHHGSHNATLKGNPDDPWPNLSWLGQGEYAGEFTAMVTAVRKWAMESPHWDHPLAAIRSALLTKAANRVFQTDTPPSPLPDTAPEGSADGQAQGGMSLEGTKAWKDFATRHRVDDLYFDIDFAP